MYNSVTDVGLDINKLNYMRTKLFIFVFEPGLH